MRCSFDHLAPGPRAQPFVVGSPQPDPAFGLGACASRAFGYVVANSACRIGAASQCGRPRRLPSLLWFDEEHRALTTDLIVMGTAAADYPLVRLQCSARCDSIGSQDGVLADRGKCHQLRRAVMSRHLRALSRSTARARAVRRTQWRDRALAMHARWCPVSAAERPASRMRYPDLRDQSIEHEKAERSSRPRSGSPDRLTPFLSCSVFRRC